MGSQPPGTWRCFSCSPARSGPWKPCLLVPSSAKRQGASEQLQGLRSHSCDRGSYCQALARASRAPAPLQLLLQVPGSPVQMVSRHEVCTDCVPHSLQNPGKACGTPSWERGGDPGHGIRQQSHRAPGEAATAATPARLLTQEMLEPNTTGWRAGRGGSGRDDPRLVEQRQVALHGSRGSGLHLMGKGAVPQVSNVCT